MKELLIINSATFGKLTDSYMWCKYLKDKFKITFITFDSPHIKTEMNGVDLKLVSCDGGAFISRLRFILTAFKHAFKCKGAIFVVYFCDALWLKRILFWKKMTLDIRTFSVNRDPKRRIAVNKNLMITARRYDNITVISEGLKTKLGLPDSKVKILPLGADRLSSIDTSFDQIKLLYVGILSGREINKTILGIKQFKEKHPDNKITYDIVGDGHYNELIELNELVDSLDLNDTVTLYGRLPYNQLHPFFDRCNVGVSFVPKTDYYEFQPPTKTFEYIISGLYTIATSTYCNKSIVTPTNGLLIDDNPDDFTKALETVWDKRESLDHDKIRESLSNYNWNNIANTILYPILNESATDAVEPAIAINQMKGVVELTAISLSSDDNNKTR